MQCYRTAKDLDTALLSLQTVESRFAAIHARCGTPALRQTPAGLEGLLLIVTEQFLSLASAAAIWQRVCAGLVPFTAQTVLHSQEELLSLGLSRAKARTFVAVADAMVAGRLNFDALNGADNDVVHDTLCALPGIGPWTADIYLLTCLGRADAWPAGDLALQVAMQDVFQLPERPTAHVMVELAKTWRPHRSCAALLLWSHYRSLKGLKQA